MGLTRSAVWKAIRQFPKWGIPFESITGKGYRIPRLSLLSQEKIRIGLSLLSKNLLHTIEIQDTLTSTNDYLLNLVSVSALKNICCIAERQTAGKGRRGRRWFSPFAQNIYMSLLWHFQKDLSALSGLSLVVALAITKGLQQLGVNDLRLKWPNDISWNYRKLAGCLIEISGESNDSASTVIGMGINVQMILNKTSEITQPWVDLKQITNQVYDRNQVISMVLDEVIQALVLFQEQGFTPFVESWKLFDLAYGQAIWLETPNGIIHGIGRGINEHGHLLLELASKEWKSFSSGEVSLHL